MSRFKIVGGGILGAVVLVGGGAAAFYMHTHPQIHIVNTTGKDGVTVTIDGEVVAASLANAANESPGATVAPRIGSGSHKIEAKDATGKVIDTATFEFKSGSNGYLYAPGHDAKVCFILQTDQYSTNSAMPGLSDRYKTLDPSKHLWEMAESIDYWFQDSPQSVSISNKGPSTVTKHALRQTRCGDPAFKD